MDCSSGVSANAQNGRTQVKFNYEGIDWNYQDVQPVNIVYGLSLIHIYSLMKNFGLDEKRKINTFSKGMKKQLSVICGICSGTEYLFCDETVDGLDPVMRQAVKSIFASDMAQRQRCV